MKKINILSSLIFSVLALCGTFQASAQEGESIIATDKTATYDYTKRTGTITLDSYVTGYVKEVRKAIPADIIMVLDFSSSMSDKNKNTMLATAANDFVDKMVASANDNNIDHRIGIITFGTGAHIKTDYLPIKGNTTNVTTLKNIINSTNPATGETATRYELAIMLARNMVDGGHQYSDIRQNENSNAAKVKTTYNPGCINPPITLNDSFCSKTTLSGKRSDVASFVIFLTDGEPTGAPLLGNIGQFYGQSQIRATRDTPGTDGDTTDGSRYTTGVSENDYSHIEFGIANHAIRNANYIKDTTKTSIYTIQLGTPSKTGLANLAEDALTAISSKYPQAKRYRKKDWGTATTDTTSFYQHITSVDQAHITGAFTKISSSIEKVVNIQYGAETVVNDFINNTYFKLTDAVDPNNPWSSIHVYTVKCTGIDSDGTTRTFSKAVADTVELHESDGIKLKVVMGSDDGQNDQVLVSGFDYSANWCGLDEKKIAHGKKLLVKLPFEFIGGEDTPVPSTVKTNGDGSGVYPAERDEDGNIKKDDEGNVIYDTEPEKPYISPQITFCTIQITRDSLDKGESAIYEVFCEGKFVARVSLNGTEAGSVSKSLYGLPGGSYTVNETGWNWAYDKKVYQNGVWVSGSSLTQSVDDPDTVVDFRFGGNHKTGSGPEDLHNHDEEYKVNTIDVSDL